MIITKITGVALIGIAVTALASCATTKAVENTNTSSIEISEPEPTEKIKKEPKQISVQNTSNQQEKQFKALVDSLELKVTSQPKQTYSGTAFSAPYIVSVTDQNGGVSDLSITVSYPSARSNDTITYNNIQLKTDSEGKVTFTPDVPAIAVKDEVTFYPTPISSNANIVQAAYEAATKAPYVVKSSYVKWPGGILFVYDFNENGKATTNNFTMLQTMRNAGINAGNCPVSDTSYFNKTVADLRKACIDMTGGEIKNSAAFLVMGSIKYAEPAFEEEGSATVKLVADITCVDMKNGNVLYTTSINNTATDKTKWSADQKCRKALAEKAADAIIYGM